MSLHRNGVESISRAMKATATLHKGSGDYGTFKVGDSVTLKGKITAEGDGKCEIALSSVTRKAGPKAQAAKPASKSPMEYLKKKQRDTDMEESAGY